MSPHPPRECYCDLVLNSIAEGVITVGRDMRVTAFNRAAGAMAGVDPAGAIGKTCSDLFAGSSCPIGGALVRAMDTGEVQERFRVVFPRRDGGETPVEASVSALRDDGGDIVGGVATLRDLSDVERLRREIQGRYTFADIISKNHEMRRIFDILPDVALSEATVLIEGPSGSGKELLARALHQFSERRDGPLVVVNCGALPDTLLESELFGYRKGAFTDAKNDKPGRFALADGGTIFLDEIGDVSPALQVRLLRVLQEREIEPLGATAPRKVDVRVVAATNRNLARLVEKEEFRQDLYYRLNVVRLDLPPLRERREDIPLLVDHFIERFNARTGKRIERVSDAAMDRLMEHEFPGNIRELENAIEHAFILCHGPVIEPEHFPRELQKTPSDTGEESLAVTEGVAADPAQAEGGLRQMEIAAIEDALRRHQGRRARAAEELGIDKSTLWRKMKKYGITAPPASS